MLTDLFLPLTSLHKELSIPWIFYVWPFGLKHSIFSYNDTGNSHHLLPPPPPIFFANVRSVIVGKRLSRMTYHMKMENENSFLSFTLSLYILKEIWQTKKKNNIVMESIVIHCSTSYISQCIKVLFKTRVFLTISSFHFWLNL